MHFRYRLFLNLFEEQFRIQIQKKKTNSYIISNYKICLLTITKCRNFLSKSGYKSLLNLLFFMV